MITRKGRLVPQLIEMLKREVPRNAKLEPEAREVAFGFAYDLIEILQIIGDGRAAPVLAEVLDGFNGTASLTLRDQAFYALENMTHVAFLRPRGIETSFAVPDAAAEQEPDRSYEPVLHAMMYSRCAAKYRVWLAGASGSIALSCIGLEIAR